MERGVTVDIASFQFISHVLKIMSNDQYFENNPLNKNMQLFAHGASNKIKRIRKNRLFKQIKTRLYNRYQN